MLTFSSDRLLPIDLAVRDWARRDESDSGRFTVGVVVSMAGGTGEVFSARCQCTLPRRPVLEGEAPGEQDALLEVVHRLMLHANRTRRLEELTVWVARAEAPDQNPGRDGALLAAVRRMHEQNPMLELRGVRLGLVVSGLFAMRVRAIAEAAADRAARGLSPRPEIMVSLVIAR